MVFVLLGRSWDCDLERGCGCGCEYWTNGWLVVSNLRAL